MQLVCQILVTLLQKLNNLCSVGSLSVRQMLAYKTFPTHVALANIIQLLPLFHELPRDPLRKTFLPPSDHRRILGGNTKIPKRIHF